ncbi:MAG: hypothetical protein OSA99_13650 [Acidimicrobiales bacterium]|nr:hypothetical protein [Acidimicrobiales bacterium]
MTTGAPADHDGQPSSGISPRFVGGGLLVAAVVAFVVQNTDDTEVSWLVFDTTQPLWIVLLVTAAAALLAAELITSAYRRRKRKD